MATQLRDLGPEIPDCSARYHGTYSAANNGCICPAALADRRERNRRYEQRRGPRDRTGAEIHRWRDVDPQAMKDAINGLIAAWKLTTDERRQVVSHLVAAGKTNLQIANHLHWSGGGPRGANAVAKFRGRWQIRAAAPQSDRSEVAA